MVLGFKINAGDDQGLWYLPLHRLELRFSSFFIENRFLKKSFDLCVDDIKLLEGFQDEVEL